MDIAAIVRQARVEAGLSQAQLAERAGTSQPAVARLEAGEGSPSLSTVQRLVGAAGYELGLSLVPKRVVRDAVVEAYKVDVDRTLLRDNLRKTVDERLKSIEAFNRDAAELRRAVAESKRRGKR